MQPVVFVHLYKCAGSSVRRMLFDAFRSRVPNDAMHVPELTGDATTNLPMLEARGEPLPTGLWLLADHSPFGVFEDRVLAAPDPFRLTMVREPLDRFEAWYHFGALHGHVRPAFAKFRHDLADMPTDDLVEMAGVFDRHCGFVPWFDPVANDIGRAIANFERIDVVATFDDMIGFCRRFNERYAHDVMLRTQDIQHVNHTDRPSAFSATQRSVIANIIADDVTFWDTATVQRRLTED